MISANQKKLCLIIDVYGWAFHNIAKEIKKRYPSDIFLYKDFGKLIQRKVFKFDKYNRYVYFFIPIGQRDKTKIKIKNYSTSKRLFYFMYENYTWKSSQKWFYLTKEKFKFLNGVFAASPNIYHDLKKNFNINLCGSCYDGVDEKIFNYKGYDTNTYKNKKKLVIGWVGNSNINENGKIKRFKELKQFLESEKINDKFVFKPLDAFEKKIEHNKVPEYIKDIDIIVCFSKSEGTPNQILEASSCGKCWISTDVGIVSMLQNTLPNNPCGIILEKINDIEKEKESLRKALMTFYENRELMEEYGKNGRKAIEHKFRIDLTVNNIIKHILNN